MIASKLGCKRAGFTFMEVVASVAIVMCVIGVLLPVFLRAKSRAQEAGCASNLQQFAAALHLYAQDHDGRFPPRDHDLAPLMTYIKNQNVYLCPDEPEPSQRRWKSGANRTDAKGDIYEIYGSYEYRSGLTSDEANTEMIARDWGIWHRGGVNVLNLGGQVKWIPGGDRTHLTATPRPMPPTDLQPPAKEVPGVHEDL